MTAIDEPPALAHIEKTLADSYRKEIDQEENTWRSLPFFAATLALQLAALFQLLDRLPPRGTGLGWIALALLAISFVCSLVALGILAASIYPAKFQYIAKDAALLDYALQLIRDEQDAANPLQAEPMSPLVTLKGTLAWQYSVATDQADQQAPREAALDRRTGNDRRCRFDAPAGGGDVRLLHPKSFC